MSTSEFTLPKIITSRPERPAEGNVPPTQELRRQIKDKVRAYVTEKALIPPIPIDDLKVHALELAEREAIPHDFLNFLAVLMNNQSWEETLAKIPFNRRLLLLPKCLRTEAVCPAPFDEFGLLCKQCGQCSLEDLQLEAEKMGYAVLIAEGSALVMAIIETGKIDAIVGVSCLSVLERAFPYMEAAAVPGVAIPLLQGDCLDTNVDLDWVWDAIHLTHDDKTRRLDLEELRREVSTWFREESLETIMGPASGESEQIARTWLRKNGKRWRPFLAACVAKALAEDPEAPLPEGFHKLAVGIECFHKASLIHDDIQDGDAYRYGEQTLHEIYGEAMAINIGDLLIGEGYRLIAECGADPVAVAEMLRIAAVGQRDLCIGQGRELEWLRTPMPLKVNDVLGIFSKKTAPAFEVALRCGAAFAGADAKVHDAMQRYSEALGIAYQVHDDLQDSGSEHEADDIEALRPSVLLAMAHQRAKGPDKKLLTQLWSRQTGDHPNFSKDVARLYEKYEIVDRAQQLENHYRDQAVKSLQTLESINLKGLLRRVLGKIFDDIEIKDWCREYEARNAADREARAPFTV
ncbi:polyprenyl synthetase family protein [Acanthopleuribacter pedis]|uniref:Polyprenyl synthetase family protein n=1 Tax=Acanthopleuribacter pedis TaxID=442870 RepID=A0A8J7QBI4_9BACT|nr:polyprenyl synthetase family protein [Acanthopleuribacter pedis]MBO1323092.1 polyprenyl synthetase family protein [Acanthopleuribacter pedis]